MGTEDDKIPIFICAECARERGYLFPERKPIMAIIRRCDLCGDLGPCWDMGEMVPGWEDEGE